MRLQIKRWMAQIFFALSANLGAFGLKTGFCYPFFYCNAGPASTSACPLRAMEKSVYDHSFTWKLLTYPLLILGTVGILTGRAVCGWACPIGFLQRGTGYFARKLSRYKIVNKIGKLKIEKYLR